MGAGGIRTIVLGEVGPDGIRGRLFLRMEGVNRIDGGYEGGRWWYLLNRRRSRFRCGLVLSYHPVLIQEQNTERTRGLVP